MAEDSKGAGVARDATCTTTVHDRDGLAWTCCLSVRHLAVVGEAS